MAARPATATDNHEARARDRDEPVTHIFGAPQIHTAPHKGTAAKTKITCGRCGWCTLYFIQARMGAGGSLNIENHTWTVVNTLDPNTACVQCGISFNHRMAQKQIAEIAAKEAAEKEARNDTRSGTSPPPQTQNTTASSVGSGIWQKQPEKPKETAYPPTLNQRAIQNHTTALQTAAEIQAK